MQIETTVRWEVTSARMATTPKTQKTSVGKDLEKWELFSTVGRNVEYCSHYGK